MKPLIFLILFVLLVVGGLYVYSTTLEPETKTIEIEARGAND